MISSWKKGSLGRGRSGTSAHSFVLCFSVFWGDFLLQISQKFLSEIAPPTRSFSWKPPSRKTPKRSCWNDPFFWPWFSPCFTYWKPRQSQCVPGTNRGRRAADKACVLKVAGVLRGNTIRGNTTRNSERKMALWEGLWEGLWKTSENLWKPLKTSKNLWKPLKTSEKPLKKPSENLWTLPLRDPLRDPLRGRFPSQNLSVLLPLIVLPLETPTMC